jgi:hypothetical protein
MERANWPITNQVRLDAIKIELDQCWDLRPQRDARREFGQHLNEAKVRPPSVVERYKQKLVNCGCIRSVAGNTS